MRRDGMVQYIVGTTCVTKGRTRVFALWQTPGTTSLVLGAQGDKVAESRHLPYGGERWRWPEDSTFPTDYRFTGQRWEQPLGIYTMGARWYDPYINRSLSPDSIIPDFSNPQSLNRYSYVYNRPLVAIDTSGHFAWFVTGLVGAAAGAIVSYGAQVVANIAESGQLTVDAFTQVDTRQIATGAIVGGVAGLTMGAGAAVLGTGWIATGYLGVAGGVMGGRAEHLVNATWAEYDRWKSGQSFEVGRLWDDALTSGLFDIEDIVIDAATGELGAFAGKGFGELLQKAGFISLQDVRPTGSEAIPTVRYLPGGDVALALERGPVYLSQDRFQQLMAAFVAGNVELAQEILSQATEETIEGVSP